MAELITSTKHAIGKKDLIRCSLLYMKITNGIPVRTMRTNDAKFTIQYKLPLLLLIVKEVINKNTNATGLAIVHMVLK